LSFPDAAGGLRARRSALELARRRGFPLASLDGRLNDAAKAVGITLYRPD
jgi:hypothetical protein